MEVVKANVAELLNDPDNARKHNQKNLDAIRKSLELYGQQKPIVVGANNTVIAGNGTLLAANELGWDTIDVVYTHLTGKEARAYAIADNRTSELAEWDDEVLGALLGELRDTEFFGGVGFDEDETQKILDKLVAESEGDEELINFGGDADNGDGETTEKIPSAVTGDIWLLGDHRLTVGRFTDGRDADNILHSWALFTNKEPIRLVEGRKSDEKAVETWIEPQGDTDEAEDAEDFQDRISGDWSGT